MEHLQSRSLKFVERETYAQRFFILEKFKGSFHNNGYIFESPGNLKKKKILMASPTPRNADIKSELHQKSLSVSPVSNSPGFPAR